MAYISREQTGGNQKTFTISMWVKRANVTDEQTFFSVSNGGSYMQMKFNTSEYLEYNDGPSTIRFITSRTFRDPAAWYHIVIKYDSTESVEADRFKMFINGVQETEFGTATYPGLNTDSQVNVNTGDLRIGVDQTTGGTYYGEMSHVQLVDGTALDATSFGSVDSTSGIWKIKTSCYGTPGTNGFCLKMEDRTNLDLDSSSNAHTFTTTGTLTPTYDNPSDNFCTMNPLDAQSSNGGGINYAYGNTQVTDGDANWRSSWGTLGNSSGKYYFEAKITGSGASWGVGVCEAEQKIRGETKFWATSRGYAVNRAGEKCNNGNETVWYGTIIGQNDIVSCALDLDNGKIYFADNGTWIDSGDPTSGATGTGAAYSVTTGVDKLYLPAFAGYDTPASLTFNFGNGYFGSTAISSAGTNASGIGSFEYDVPTGYTAWSTKGFNV